MNQSIILLEVQQPLLLTWVNFNSSMNKLSHAQLCVGCNYGCTVEV